MHQSVFKKREGQGLVEYALILGLAALAVIAIVQLMRPAIEETFRNFADNAPVAPPSLANYTPPPTNTVKPTLDPKATHTHTPTSTSTPTSTATGTATATQTPTGTATPSCAGYGPYFLPGTVQAENFACGGASFAFIDSLGDGGPGSGAYRKDVTTAGPDLSSGGSGYYAGWFVASEWISYDVEIQSSKAYDLGFRVASANSNGRFFIEYAKANQVLYTSPTISVPNTGGNSSWKTIILPSAPLISGKGQIRFVFQNGGFNLDYFEVYGAPLPTATNTAQPTTQPTTTPTASNTPLPTATNTPTATPVAACKVYPSTDVTKTLNDAWKLWNWVIPGETSSILSVPTGAGTVTDVNVVNLKGTHSA
ncbi:MAG: carbohydrate-binding protein, partial [Anaerolineae bacterium]|nr:carbohydrate-binding protein [Anaerolineae bacterium]